MISNYAINVFLSTYRLIQLSVLIGEISLCGRWLLMQKLTAVEVQRINVCRVLSHSRTSLSHLLP